MYKPTHTEHDYTAEYLGSRVHKGSGRSCKKRSSERRGRKSKKGRVVRKFRVTLLPNPHQESCLDMDLEFFNEMYLHTLSMLYQEPKRTASGNYYGYDIKNRRKTVAIRKSKWLSPHTPKFIMNSQNSIIKAEEWMKECTYQVSYRAVVNAFSDFTKPVEEREFNHGGNTYEAKICYRLISGYLYLKKFDQMVEIKETIPIGSLETIRVTKSEAGWSAVVEILEPYDKAEDIREGRKGVLETNTKESTLKTNELDQRLLERKARFFTHIANTIINEEFEDRSVVEKMTCYQNVYDPEEVDIGLLNMACVAANARIYKYRKRNTPPNISKNYIALSTGFYIKDDKLYLKWGAVIPVQKGSRLNRKPLEYIVIKKEKDGVWTVSGKRRKRNIFRNLSRICKQFSWKDDIIF